MDKVRVLRIIEYVGTREWVEKQVINSIHGTRRIGSTEYGGEIRAATIGSYPEILEQLKEEEPKRYSGEG